MSMAKAKKKECIRLTVVFRSDAESHEVASVIEALKRQVSVAKVTKQRRRYRDSKNGAIVTAAFAKAHPERTQLEWS